jgi:hypothetical protein
MQYFLIWMSHFFSKKFQLFKLESVYNTKWLEKHNHEILNKSDSFAHQMQWLSQLADGTDVTPKNHL